MKGENNADQLDEIDSEHLENAWNALDLFYGSDPYALTRHHIDSYDRFLGGGLADIILSLRPIQLIKNDDVGPGGVRRKVEITVRIGEGKVSVDVPTVVDGRTGKTRPLLPNEARLKDMTYDAGIYADVRVETKVDGVVVEPKVPLAKSICLGRIPLMLHSRHCFLHDLSDRELRDAGECPNDRGGYFVVDGKEKIVVPQLENVLNRFYVRKGTTSDPDVAYIGYVKNTSPDDPIPKTTTFYVRSATASGAPWRRGTISVSVDKISKVRTAMQSSGPGGSRGSGGVYVPLFVLFRALGVESDRDVMRHVVYDVEDPDESDVVEFLRPSAMEAHRMGVLDQGTAVAWLSNLVPDNLTLRNIMDDHLFPNVGRNRANAFSVKALFLGQATAKLVRAALGKVPFDDRDDYVNQRLLLSGTMLANLFRDIYIRERSRTERRIQAEYQSGSWRVSGDVTRMITDANLAAIFESGSVTADRIHRSLKGSWGADEAGAEGESSEAATKDGAKVQDLARLTYMSYVSHVRRINNPFDRSVKMPEPHHLRASQWGAVCPVESPDGPNIGLLNHLSVLSRISLGPSDGGAGVVRAIVGTGMVVTLDDLLSDPDVPFDLSSLSSPSSCSVFVDDTWIAITTSPRELAERLRASRREGKIADDVSVAWDIVGKGLHVLTSRGRFLRPLCVVTSSPKSSNESSAPLGTLPLPLGAALAVSGGWNSLFENGGLEWIDIAELRTRLVAMRPSDVARASSGIPTNGGTRPLGERYTHCELHIGAGLLSPAAACFPMLNRNNAPRNALGIAQFKQAIGLYSSAYQERMDALAYVLHHNQRPVVGTSFGDRLSPLTGGVANGENLIVAVLTYSGYNMEDAIIVNIDSVQRGRFHITHYESHSYDEGEVAGSSSDHGPNGSNGSSGSSGKGGKEGKEGRWVVEFANPDQIVAERGVDAIDRTSRSQNSSCASLGPDGLPVLGSRVAQGDVLLGRVVRRVAEKRRPGDVGEDEKKEEVEPDVDRSVISTRKTSGIVDRVAVFPVPDPPPSTMSSYRPDRCKVRTRSYRQPELGDKLGSRFSQKGVVGMLMASSDMPFCSSTGIIPDIVINPHAFPSRNTVAHIVESLLGKAGAGSGARFAVNTLEEPAGDPVGVASATLERLGMHPGGEEILHNGRTGEQIDASVYVGVSYYGRLKHMVMDKYQTRGRGAVNAITRQPVKTADGGSGGLRIGEMEKDALLAHGVSTFLKESMMDRSDRFRVLVDADEGTIVSSNRTGGAIGLVNSGIEGGPPLYVNSEIPYAFKVLEQELATMGIGMRMRVEGAGIDGQAGGPETEGFDDYLPPVPEESDDPKGAADAHADGDEDGDGDGDDEEDKGKEGDREDADGMMVDEEGNEKTNEDLDSERIDADVGEDSALRDDGDGDTSYDSE
jgi:DNA-directed RNA polymerase II subunit RPB2